MNNSDVKIAMAKDTFELIAIDLLARLAPPKDDENDHGVEVWSRHGVLVCAVAEYVPEAAQHHKTLLEVSLKRSMTCMAHHKHYAAYR